jgi:hypothetical protein
VSGKAPALLHGTGWAVMALAAACGNAALVLTLASAAVPLSGLVLLAMAIPWSPRPRVTLTQHAVSLLDVSGLHTVAYRDVVALDVEPTRVTLRTPAGCLAVPTEDLLEEERDHVRAQIECAAERAHGKGYLPPELPAPLTFLMARGESTRAWLERVDAAAASLGEGGAYRQVEVGVEDLWIVLESPDAPPSLRVAAARILARVAPRDASVRIGHVLATERDQGTRARIRVALEENVDVAARELDGLESGTCVE